MKQTTKPFLHNDVLQEILLRLPMKRLAQCRRLSKYWNDIISRPRFSVRGRSCSPNRTLLIYRDSLTATIYPRHNGGDSILRARSWYVEEKSVKKNGIVVGTWDGLICLSPAETETGNYAMVWNPVLKDVQKCQFEHISDGSYFFGFGFDAVNNAYKVIKVIQSKEETSIEIHNLYTKVSSFILLSSSHVSFQLTNAAPVTVHGYSHWIGVNLQNRKLEIVWFDLVNEKFVNVPFSSSMPNIKFHLDIDSIVSPRPKAELEIDDLKLRLGIFKGSVCLFVSHSTKVEIWSMKYLENDDKCTSSRVWTKNFEFKLSHTRKQVLGFTANNELVIGFIGNEDYVVCDPWTQGSVFPIGNWSEKSINQVVTYIEGLVPVKHPKS